MSINSVSFTEGGDEESDKKFKCSNHKYYTNDRAQYEKHLMDPSLKHIEQISNGTCFYCGDRLDADALEGVQYRHHITGKATHKKCREKMYQEIIDAGNKKES